MSPLLLALVVAQPAWPVTDPDLPPAAFADPARWPDDPAYGADEGCDGQLALFGFVPACASAADPDVPAGLSVDRAWAITLGAPSVTLALATSGVDLEDPDLVARYALNPGELPLPDVGPPTVRHDANGDGAFTVLDYTSATGTTAPTLDTVLDRRLLDRADRGDANGNGLLDPGDLLQIFADGVDDDDDGYVDDIVGWDFLDDDPDPTAPAGEAGPAHARRAAATADNGVGGAGACPRCTILPVRVSSRGLAGADRVAVALAYASRRGAPVFALTAAAVGERPLLTATLDLAAGRGTLVVATAGLSADRVAPTAWPDQRVLVVGGVGPDATDAAEATTFVAPDPCAGTGGADVVAPSRCDRGGAALVAGVAGLVVSAARGAGEELAALEPPLTPGELWSVLAGSTDDLAAPGWDARTAAGRVDARAAVDRVVQRRIPPHGRIVDPAPGAVLDPSGGGPAGVRVQVSRSRHTELAWTMSAARGRAPGPDDFEQIDAGRVGPGEARTFAATLPLLGWRADPTAPETPEITVQVRLQAEGTAVVLRRVVTVHRDLFTWPAFPVELGAAVTGGVRLARLALGEPNRILVATADGRLHALDANGRPVDGFPARGPGLDWFALGGHPQIPAVSGGALPADAAASLLAPISVGALPGAAGPLLVTVTAGGRAVAFGPRGAVQAGFPTRARGGLARPAEAPAGVTSPIALGDDALLVPTLDGLRIVGADGASRAELGLGPASAAAIRRGEGWLATSDALVRFGLGDGAVTRRVPIEIDAPPEGRVTAWRAAPVLFDLEGSLQIALGPVGGRLVEMSRDGAPRTRPGRVTTPGLAVARLGPAGPPSLLGGVAPPGEARLGAWVARPPRVGEGRTLALGAHATAEPTVADVDGDGRPEALFGDDLGRVRAVNADGRAARGFPKVAGEPLAGAPAVGDIDGDGRPDLVAVTRRGRLWAWRLPSEAALDPRWSSPRGEARSRGDAAAVAARPATADPGCRSTPGAAPLAWLALALALRRGRRRAAEGLRERP